jgi:hypothetical protein
MQITGGTYNIPDDNFVHITLANGNYLNIKADGTIIVENAGSFGSYTLELPSVDRADELCRMQRTQQTGNVRLYAHMHR